MELTEPLMPESPDRWRVPAHSRQHPIGKTITHHKNPAVGFVRMNDTKGLFFQTEMDVVFSCSWRRKVHEVAMKLYVQVNATNNEIFQLV